MGKKQKIVEQKIEGSLEEQFAALQHKIISLQELVESKDLKLRRFKKRDTQLEKLYEKHDEQLDQLEEEHEIQFKALEERHERELDKLVSRHEQEIEELESRHERETEKLEFKFKDLYSDDEGNDVGEENKIDDEDKYMSE